MDHGQRAAGWYADPSRRFEFRWFNGTAWTADVALHGDRFVDHAWAHGPQAGSDRNGRAVTALVLGLVAVALVWVPVLFVAGAGAAAVGSVMAVLALRRPPRVGRPMAVWGLCLSLVAFAGVPVGWMFTQHLVDRIDQSLEPGPYEVTVDRCDTARFSITLHATITNRDDAAHGYSVTVQYLVDDEVVATESTRTATVRPGESTTFVTIARHRVEDDRTAECVISDVTGGGLLLP